MERVRALTLAAAGVLALAGCASIEKTSLSVQQSIGVAPPPAASQLACFWQRRPVPLPDPVRDGSQRYGLPGQMFLLTPSGAPADVAGDLTVVVYDETQRPAGQPPKQAEVWHFTADKLKQLVTSDERFGRSVALFLPWVDGWQDVTAVRILARYDVKDQPTLYASEVKLTLDLTGGGTPVWNDAGGTRTVGYDTRTVPDPAKLLQAATPNLAAPAAPAVAAPATSNPLPTPRQWPANQPPFPQMSAPPGAPVPGPLQPIIIPRGV